MLSLRNLHLSYPPKTLLEDVSFSLLKGERVALVGYNGEGKSSIFRLITGEIVPDAGTIDKSPSLRIGYLSQEPSFESNSSVLDAVKKALSSVLEKIRLFEEAILQGENKKAAELTVEIEHLGGFDVEHRIEKVLNRLGISAREQIVQTLSGGEQRRVDLARVLLSQPDLFLLDEPTNHLDIDSIAFLSSFLKRNQTPVLFVSHDRFFIDEIATRILELDKGHLYAHQPPFAEYIAARLVREESAERTHHRKEQLLKTELSWLRAGVKARTTKQQARIERAIELKDSVAQQKSSLKEKKISIESAPQKRLAKSILECIEVTFGYGERILFRGVNLNLMAGMRIGIIGPNGCGKTSFLSLLTGQHAPHEGQVKRGPHTQCAVFEQDRKSLNLDYSLKQVVSPESDFVFLGERKIHIASYLEKFLFEPSELNRKVHTLSGGEQNRLLLAKLFTTGANCLIFDEPTNDLDLTSLAVLEETILHHRGVALLVSHDRAFLDRVCTHILAFVPGEKGTTVTLYEGNYSFFADHYKTVVNPAPKTESKAVPAKAIKKKRNFKEEQEYQSLQNRIEQAEQELSALQAQLNEGTVFREDASKAVMLTKELGVLQTSIDEMYQRWQELEDLGS